MRRKMTEEHKQAMADARQAKRAAPIEKHPGQLSAARTIRVACYKCCGESWKEVELCQCAKSCDKWPWRFGIAPHIAEANGKLTRVSLFVPEPPMQALDPSADRVTLVAKVIKQEVTTHGRHNPRGVGGSAQGRSA